MLDQNTDRMWYVIGAVLVGASIILLANKTMPQLFASVAGSFENLTNQTTDVIGEMHVNVNNLLANGYESVSNSDYMMKVYNFADTDITDGEWMRVTLKGELHPDKTGFALYNSGGHGNDRVVTLTHDDFNESGIAEKEFTWKESYSREGNHFIHLYVLYNSRDSGVDNVPNTIEWIKLERVNE